MLSKTKIQDIMVKGVFSVELEDTVHKADTIMKEENIRHLPVIDKGKLIGLITERSIVEYSLKKLYDYDDEFGEEGHNKIIDFQQIMAKEVHVIYPEDSLKKAVELMTKKKIDCLPVVDWDKNLLGIITSIDILLFVNKVLGD